MKTILLSIALLFALACLSVAYPTNLREALLATPWTWDMPKQPHTVLRFTADGIVRSSRPWVARWVAVGLRTVEIELAGHPHKARLTFSEDFTSFEGVHFNRATITTGRPVSEKQRPTVKK